MVKKEEVKEYYDDFINHQEKIGISTRQRIIAKNVKKIGVKKNSNIFFDGTS